MHDDDNNTVTMNLFSNFFLRLTFSIHVLCIAYNFFSNSKYYEIVILQTQCDYTRAQVAKKDVNISLFRARHWRH